MVNQSKVREKRFWDVWKNNGSVYPTVIKCDRACSYYYPGAKPGATKNQAIMPSENCCLYVPVHFKINLDFTERINPGEPCNHPEVLSDLKQMPDYRRRCLDETIFAKVICQHQPRSTQFEDEKAEVA